jgi:hypothetical protein
MKTIFNYNTFLENMDKKFKNNLFSSLDRTKENIHDNEKEQQIIKEILDAIEKKTNDKKNPLIPHIRASGMYTNAYVSTLSCSYDKIPSSLNEVIRENIKEKQNNTKKKKSILKSPIIKKKVEKIKNIL